MREDRDAWRDQANKEREEAAELVASTPLGAPNWLGTTGANTYQAKTAAGAPVAIDTASGRAIDPATGKPTADVPLDPSGVDVNQIYPGRRSGRYPGRIVPGSETAPPATLPRSPAPTSARASTTKARLPTHGPNMLAPMGLDPGLDPGLTRGPR